MNPEGTPMTTTPIASHHAPSEHHHTPGFRAVSLRGEEGLVDPFLNVDLFHMSMPTFRPHPHAGFSAVTYLLPESPGSFRNRDSRGDVSIIGPGTVHWTLAGVGIVHEEVPTEPGVDCWGLQIFVDLPADQKHRAPWTGHAEPEAIPQIDRDGARLRVLAGDFGGVASSIRPLGEATPTLLDVTLDPGAKLELPTSSARRTWLLVIDGGAQTDGRTLARHSAAVFADTDGTAALVAGSAGLRGIIGSGAPLRQRNLWSGPFCMTTEEELRQAALRYRRGEMGTLTPSF